MDYRSRYERKKSPIRRCCDRWPWPSVFSTCICLAGVGTFCAFAHLASEDAIAIFKDTAASYTIENTLYWVKISVYCITALTVFLAAVFLAVSCLATGSVRKEHICRFGSKYRGFCQIATATIISYVLFLLWIVITAILVIPNSYFFIIKQCHCGDPGGCIDLRQYGFVNITEPNSDVYSFCDKTLYCDQNPYILYFISLCSGIVVLIMLGHFLMILSANWSHVKHKYRTGVVSRHMSQGRYKTQSLDTLRNSRDLMEYSGQSLSVISGNTIDSTHIRSTRDPISYHM
ncbi:neuronal membrane glycoprotein M6-b-like [Glandiceps talaboti]